MYRGRSYSRTDRARPAIPSNFGRSPGPPAPRRRPSDRFLRTLAGRGLACLGIGGRSWRSCRVSRAQSRHDVKAAQIGPPAPTRTGPGVRVGLPQTPGAGTLVPPRRGAGR